MIQVSVLVLEDKDLVDKNAPTPLEALREGLFAVAAFSDVVLYKGKVVKNRAEVVCNDWAMVAGKEAA